MEIPFRQLDALTLHNMIEEFVTRDGTDYGETEMSLEEKVQQVMDQLVSGEAAIYFDEAAQCCEILTKGESRTEHGGSD